MVPQMVMNGPNTCANIDTNPKIYQPVGWLVTVDIDGLFNSTYEKLQSIVNRR